MAAPHQILRVTEYTGQTGDFGFFHPTRHNHLSMEWRLGESMSVNHDHYLVTQADACVERICDLGCAVVYQVIELMEQGRCAREITGLTCIDRRKVLKELKEIMSVYDARRGVPSRREKRTESSA